MIACLAIPYFAAQIERRDNEALRETPLAIGGQPWETQPIFAFSQEVAHRGVRPGLSLRQAHVLAPQAHFMPAHQPHYQETSEEMADVLADFSSLVEPADCWRLPTKADDLIRCMLPAHYFVDLDDVPAKEILPLTQQMGKTVREQTSLCPAVGIAQHKFTAQAAATITRPNHVRPVDPEDEANFLASFSLRLLPLDAETGRRLHLFGLKTLGDLASLPPSAVKAQFGREVARWQQWAQGQDNSPVQPRQPERTITAAYQFHDPLTSLEALHHLLQQIAQELTASLQAAAWQARKLRLTWETETTPRQQLEHIFRQPILVATGDTLIQLVSQPRRAGVESGIMALAITLTELTPAVPQQLTLFAAPARLGYEAVRNVAARHPTSSFYRASLAENRHPLPERRFQLQPIVL